VGIYWTEEFSTNQGKEPQYGVIIFYFSPCLISPKTLISNQLLYSHSSVMKRP
jgi:hypothetical protein